MTEYANELIAAEKNEKPAPLWLVVSGILMFIGTFFQELVGFGVIL